MSILELKIAIHCGVFLISIFGFLEFCDAVLGFATWAVVFSDDFLGCCDAVSGILNSKEECN